VLATLHVDSPAIYTNGLNMATRWEQSSKKKVLAVFWFLNAVNLSAAETHHRLVEGYSEYCTNLQCGEIVTIAGKELN
jgi:hypothetical protein